MNAECNIDKANTSIRDNPVLYSNG